MSMGMQSMKQNFDTAVEVKRRHEAVGFMLSIIEFELREILSSPDFHKLPEKEREQMVVSRAKAILFWRIQLDSYMDENVAAWINRAAQSRSPEIDISLEEAISLYTDKHKEFLPSDEDARRAATAIAKTEELVETEEEKKDSVSDSDILEQLMADSP